jgi:hypothetical protein
MLFRFLFWGLYPVQALHAIVYVCVWGRETVILGFKHKSLKLEEFLYIAIIILGDVILNSVF